MPLNPIKPMRVLVVDDSMLARKVIIDGLNSYPGIRVVGYAINATDAINKVKQLNPDVMTCDVQMPGISGIDLLKMLLPEHPLPVILVSSLNLDVFDALHAGAIDFVRKPDGIQTTSSFIFELCQKINGAAGAKVHMRAVASPCSPLVSSIGNTAGRCLIGLGASTGGTEAVLEVLKRLPEDIPGMIIVQHMPAGFTKMCAERFDKLCKMEVREAKHGDKIRPGLALVAPADLQCRVSHAPSGEYFVTCTQGEKVSGHRPSVDVLFQSMAENVRCRMIGVIMTGMGSDGAAGLLAMRKKGAYTIGQDKESCVVYGMPRVANEIGAVAEQASCENIAGVILRQLKKKE